MEKSFEFEKYVKNLKWSKFVNLKKKIIKFW